MLRIFSATLRGNLPKIAGNLIKTDCQQSHLSSLTTQVRCLGIFNRQIELHGNPIHNYIGVDKSCNLANKFLIPVASPAVLPHRTVTKFSKTKGKRKSVKTVLRRFYRLHWGGWIRTIAGRFRRLWKKSENKKRRYKRHVFCNATQSWMLDKMTTKFWRRRKYYVDDPYEPYHTREEFPATKRKPAPWVD